jgi:polysaccharide pyruvyl transferase WcaK-like protein
MRYLLVGNYGVGNLGDELLREYFLKAFPEVEWTVLDGGWMKQDRSSNLLSTISQPSSTVPRLPFGTRSLLTTPWWKTFSALQKSDGMVFGGGTLFTDIESIKAPMLWWWHAVWAWMFNKRIILAFQGIGPFRSRIGEWCAQWVVSHSDRIIVRDAKSFQRVSRWKNKNCVQSFDPVLGVFSEENLQRADERTKKVFIIIPRANATPAFFAAVRELHHQHQGECGSVRVISLEPDNLTERKACQALAQEFQATLSLPRSLQELRGALRDASLVVTQRYHGAIAALGMDIPCIAIPQRAGDKLAAIAGVHRNEALRLWKEGESALRHALHGQS